MLYYKNYKLINTFNIPAIAKEIWFPEAVFELAHIVRELNGKNYHILGSGSNVIMNHEIERVISLSKLSSEGLFSNDKFQISANYPTHKFVQLVNKNNYTGVEALYGIPGFIGGAIAMNAGSAGQSISDNLVCCNVMDKKGYIKRYYKEELNFKRRHSMFQSSGDIILYAIFKFTDKNLNNDLLIQTMAYRKLC